MSYINELARHTNKLNPNITIEHAVTLIRGRLHNPVNMPYAVLEKLFEWHFDAFGLIPEGLAIDSFRTH